MSSPTIGVIVLAAGQGRRFGPGPKQVAVAGGRPLVARVVATALAAASDEVVVVVGHAEEAVRAAVPADPRVRVVRNPGWSDGLATSVQVGIRALSADVDIAVVLLADQPGVTTSAIRAVGGSVGDGTEIARARHHDGPSHPVALARSVWGATDGMTGDQGARQLFGARDVREVELPGPRPVDIDRPADLARQRLSCDG